MKKLLMVMAAGFMLTVAAPTEAAAAETNESNAPYCYEQQGNGCWGNPGRWSEDEGERATHIPLVGVRLFPPSSSIFIIADVVLIVKGFFYFFSILS